MAHTLCLCQAELFIVPSTYAAVSMFHRQNSTVVKGGLCTQAAWVQIQHCHYQLQDLTSLSQFYHM